MSISVDICMSAFHFYQNNILIRYFNLYDFSYWVIEWRNFVTSDKFYNTNKIEKV